MELAYTKLVRCMVCRGRGTDGNGRVCRCCQGVGEVQQKITLQARDPERKSDV